MTVCEEILNFWFGESEEDSQVLEQKGSLWFSKNDQVDREIEQRFGALVDVADKQGVLRGKEPAAKRYLATILLLDQFTRNIYRGDARAFGSDSIALQLALEALTNGYDKELRPIERVFVYLPLEHSEDKHIQQQSVELFEQIRGVVSEQCQSAFDSFHDYAIRHQDIIERFGRFPHRNQILGRDSTAEEVTFLQQPNSSF